MEGNSSAREAVGVFHDEGALQDAVDELLIGGFDRSSLSLLASERAVQKKLGHRYEKVTEIEDEFLVPRIAYIGKDSRTEGEAAMISGLAYVGAVGTVGAIVASGGTVAAAILGAVAVGGVGGLIGVAFARFMEQHHARHLQEQLDHERDAIERHRIAFFARAYGEKATALAELSGPGLDRHPPVAPQYAELDRGEPIQMVLRLGTENDDFALTPKTLRFEKGKHYRLLIVNPSRVIHYISAPTFGAAIGSKNLARGVALEPSDQHLWNFVADQEGTYDIRCDIETHAEAGMVGKIIVS